MPTRLAGFAACVAVIVLGLTAVLAAGLYEPALAAVERGVGPRFARSIATVRACVDPRGALSLVGWLSHMLLVTGAVLAFVVRSIRVHRRDGVQGRHRAWGGLGCLLLVASCATQVPIGRLAGTLLAEATGITFGPAGLGWWVAFSATLLAGFSLWAVLPLYERMATALWLTGGLAAWAACVAATWAGPTAGLHPGIAPAAWTAGCGLITIAMIAAARSVIREARGETTTAVKGGKAKPQAPVERAAPSASDAATGDDASRADEWPADTADGTDYTDGSEFEDDRHTRHLSKAERKRLRKLARMSRAA